MQSDEPTLHHHSGYDPDATTDPGVFAEAPTWPPAGERSLRTLGPDRFPSGSLGSPLLWMSLGATGVVLIGLLGVLVFNQLGVFASSGATGSSVPRIALSSPTRHSELPPVLRLAAGEPEQRAVGL